MKESLRFLILNTLYPEFLQWVYARDSGLQDQPYDEQMRAGADSLFGVADFYSSNLRKLGHEASDINANNEWAQKAWAREHGIGVEKPRPVQQRRRVALHQALQLAGRTPLRHLKPLLPPVLPRLLSQQAWFYDILAAQIQHYKPDVLLNQAMGAIGSDFLLQMKPQVRLLVGQIASQIPQGKDFSCYDLVVSSLPNIVDYFRKLGIPSELHRLGFGPEVLDKLGADNKDEIPVSFVGSVSPVHQTRVRLLEYLCSNLEVKVWGTGFDGLSPRSPILACYLGSAWGVEMYEILHSSKITVDNHERISGPYANNMRLYEATGVGTLLITDWKVNLHEMFEPGKEVITYRSPEECTELIRYYLEHDDERKAIALAGQSRVLREHTYYHRMQELMDIVHKYL